MDFYFKSLCASRITSFLILTFSKFHAGIVSSFFYSLSTAAVASGIFIACGIGMNLFTKFLCHIEVNPLPAMWSSWFLTEKIPLVDLWIHEMSLYNHTLFWNSSPEAISDFATTFVMLVPRVFPIFSSRFFFFENFFVLFVSSGSTK